MQVAQKTRVLLAQLVGLEVHLGGRSRPRTDFTGVQPLDEGRHFFIAEFRRRCHCFSLQDECGNEDILDATKTGAFSQEFVDSVLDQTL